MATKYTKTVQQSIPYTRVFPQERVIETDPGTFTRSYRLDDVNFKTATDEEQIDVFHKWENLLDSFPYGSEFQVVIHNHPANIRELLDSIKFTPADDGLNAFRNELNDNILDKVSKGRNNMQQDRYLVVSEKSDHAERAIQALNEAGISINRTLKDLSSKPTVQIQSIEERLKVLFAIYNQDEDAVFENCLDKNGHPIFSLKEMKKRGLSTKDMIAPPSMKFSALTPYFMLGNTYGCSLFLKSFPADDLTTDFLANLSELPYSYLISIHYKPLEKTKIIRAAMDRIKILKNKRAKQEAQNAKDGIIGDFTSRSALDAEEDAAILMDDITHRDLMPFYVTLTITLFANSKQELDTEVSQFRAIAGAQQVQLLRATMQQEEVFNSSLPLCLNKIRAENMMTTESASILIPYTTLELNQKYGICYGVNEETKNIVSFSRLYGADNHNGLIFGTSGSGKTFAAQLEILSVLARKEQPSQVRIVDPKGNFNTFVENCGGETIELSVGSQTYINPFDLDISSDPAPVAAKSGYIIGMVEIMMGEGQHLTGAAKGAIDTAVKEIYYGYMEHMRTLQAQGIEITCDSAASPTMIDFYEALRRQKTPEANMVAQNVEMFAIGTNTTFAHRTNVNPHADLVLYDVSRLGPAMQDLALYVCLNDINNQLLENHKKKIWTWFYIDEMHLVLHSRSAAKFIADLWMTVRSRQGVPTGIMQNVESITQSDDARHILNTSSFIQILKVEKMDQDQLKALLSIPDSMDRYLNSSTQGHGVINVNRMTIPVDNEIPKGSRIYEMCSSSSAIDDFLKSH